MSHLRVQIEIERGNQRLALRASCERFPLALLGPSGAGKTTLLECISGLLRPATGHLVWRDQTMFDATRGINVPPEKRRLGYVMQDGVLFPHLNVRDNVLFPMQQRRRMAAREAKCTVDTLLDEFEVLHLAARQPANISGGERARVALARALAADPELVLLDEPFAGLDPVTREQTQRVLMQALTQRNVPAILVTHDRNESLQYAATAWVLIDGHVVQQGAPADIVRRPASLEIARFVGVDNLVAGETVSNDNGVCRVHCAGFDLSACGDVAPATPVYVCVRPEDVLLTASHEASSARNRLRARVENVRPQGGWSRIELSVGSDRSALRLQAIVTSDAQSELAIHPGQQLVAQFKASAAHLLVRAQQEIAPANAIQSGPGAASAGSEPMRS